MAPLTWRNVDDPDLGKAARILEGAVANWDRGFTNLADTAATVRANQKANRSAAAFPMLAGISSGSNVDSILAQVNGAVAPQDMTPELQEAMLRARGLGLGYDQTRTSTAATAGANNRAQTAFDRLVTQQDQEAAMADEVMRAYQGNLWGNQFQGSGSTTSGPPLNDRELLARTIMAEAGGEGAQGMLAAGSVIANRARAANGDLRGVILAPGQFSAWNSVTGYAGGEGGLDMNAMRPSEEAYAVADQIMSGQYQDPTGGATHYYNPAAANPEWGMQAGGQWTRIGNHVFGTAPGGIPSGGVPQRRPVDIAGMIPENNALGIDYYLGLADRMYRAQDTAIDDQRSDRIDYEGQVRAAQEAQTAAMQTQLRDEGWNMAQGFLNKEEAQRAIMGMGLPQDQTRLLLEGANSAFEAAPAAFTPEEQAKMDPLQQEAMRTLAVENGASTATPMLRDAMEAVGVIDPGSAGSVDASGEGTPPEVRNQGALDIVTELAGQAETLGMDETAASLMDAVNEVSEEYNADPRIVAALLKHSMYETAVWGDMQVDWEKLRNNVAIVVDPKRREELMIQENARADQQAELEGIIKDNLAAKDALSVFENRPGAEAQRRAEEARRQIAETDEALKGFMEGFRRLREDGGTGDTAQVTADDLLSMTSEERRAAMREGQAVPSPGGYSVDPEASGWNRMWAGMARNMDIGTRLDSIKGDLRWSGADPMVGAVGAIGDFFQGAASAEADASARQAAREALDWYSSPDAELLFFTNPALLEQAKEDPVGFWQRMQEQQERR